jgi:hypothetical protein
MTRIMELMAPDIYGHARVQYTSPLNGLALVESRQGRQGPYCCRRLLETAARPLSYCNRKLLIQRGALAWRFSVESDLPRIADLIMN